MHALLTQGGEGCAGRRLAQDLGAHWPGALHPRLRQAARQIPEFSSLLPQSQNAPEALAICLGHWLILGKGPKNPLGPHTAHVASSLLEPPQSPSARDLEAFRCCFVRFHLRRGSGFPPSSL